jgi:exodeoxyribonuclease V gamma subunit
LIRLHYSNRLENLIGPLAAAVAVAQQSRPLERIPIVVPNRIVEQFVKHRLSETLGIAANLEFPFLRTYLGDVAQSANSGLHILEAEDLQVVLFEKLRNSRAGDVAELRAVRSYAEAGSKTQTDIELRLFQLSGQVARLFREYSITRRELPRGWQRGLQIEKKPFDETERWQRHLWLSLFASDSSLRPECLIDTTQRWMLLPDGFAATDAESLKSALPPALHIFGLAYVGPEFAQIFARLGQLVELHIYTLNPCLEFWEDVDTPTGIARDSWVRRGQRDGPALETEEDPFGLNVPGDSPALRLWARPGREYIRLLNELTDCDFDAHFTHSTASEAPTLLERLQESILIREPERTPTPTTDEPLADDGSIRFLACPGARREAEIIANTIWSLVRQHDAARGPLRFHEIAVLMPDRLIDDYLPHLETVFADLHGIPANIVSRRFTAESHVAEAVDLLLRLPLGRFGRDEMLHLLTHPAMRRADSEISFARWRDWCDELGVFFGADEDDFARTYIPRDLYHWDQALKRLALGAFMTGQRSGDSRWFAASDQREYLPYETGPDELAGVASLVRIARSLLAEAREIRSQSLTLEDWGRLLSKLILTYLQVSAPIDERIRDYCVSAIESIATAQIRSGPVPYELAYEFATACISDVESRHGQFTERGVAVGSFSAMASIPFRVIFALGLNESDFPERSGHDPLDLRLAKRRSGDATPTERDRYLFLATLLAAREKIFMSYVGRDSRTGDRLEPSTLIRELQFILRGYVDPETLKCMTVEHPVSRYDLRYFEDLDSSGSLHDPGLFSFDREARCGARMTALRNHLTVYCDNTPLSGRDEPILDKLKTEVRNTLSRSLRAIELPTADKSTSATTTDLRLPLTALRKFLECPLQGAAQYALGMVEDDEAVGEEHEDEPLAQSVLDRTVLLREAFWKARGDMELALTEYTKALRIAQAQGRAPAGPFAEEAAKADRKRLRDWIDQTRAAGVNSLADWQDIRIGRADEFAPTDRLLDEIKLSVPIDQPGGATVVQIVKIYGTVKFMSPNLDSSFGSTLRKDPKARDFLGPFLSAIALAAAGEKPKKNFRAIILTAAEGNKTPIKSFNPPAKAQALGYLTDLASALLSGRNHYFLPIEAVEAVLDAKARNKAAVNLIDEIDGVRENEFASCGSDYGPVRNAREFEPPEEDAAKKMIEQRFGLIKSIFEK